METAVRGPSPTEEVANVIKLIYLLRRRPELSLAEFQAHWLEHHAQFGRRDSNILRYVQYHTLPDSTIGELPQAAEAEGTQPYDGLAVAWWESSETMKASMQGEVVAAALEDELRFIDHARSTALVVDEHVLIEPLPPSPIVLIECLARRADIDRKTFSERWLRHVGIAQRSYDEGLLQGYIQNHALIEGDGRVAGLEELGLETDGWDGIVTAYLHSVAILKALVASPIATEDSYAEEKTFIDHSKGVYMVTRRHVIKDLVR